MLNNLMSFKNISTWTRLLFPQIFHRENVFFFVPNENFPQNWNYFSLNENEFQNLWHKYFCLFWNVFSFFVFLFVRFLAAARIKCHSWSFSFRGHKKTFHPRPLTPLSVLSRMSDSFPIIVSLDVWATNKT